MPSRRGDLERDLALIERETEFVCRQRSRDAVSEPERERQLALAELHGEAALARERLAAILDGIDDLHG